MKDWIRTGFFATVGGFVMFILARGVFLATVDHFCGIAASAWAILVGLPIGNVTGIAVYRKHFLKALHRSDALNIVLGLLFSGAAALGSIYTLDGPAPWGFFAVLLAPCLASMLGYAIGLRIVARYQGRQ